MKENDS